VSNIYIKNIQLLRHANIATSHSVNCTYTHKVVQEVISHNLKNKPKSIIRVINIFV